MPSRFHLRLTAYISYTRKMDNGSINYAVLDLVGKGDAAQTSAKNQPFQHYASKYIS
ncbi:MAG: hypothetical protein WCK77_09455 [Verrucomicrobiota bacterium]